MVDRRWRSRTGTGLKSKLGVREEVGRERRHVNGGQGYYDKGD